MKKRILKVLGLGGAAVLALGACSAPGNAGNAGSVNGVDISEKQVDALAAEIEDGGGTVSDRFQLFDMLVANTVLEEVVQGYGGFTDTQKETLLGQCAAQLPFLNGSKKVPEGLESYCLVLGGAQYDPGLASKANEALTSAKVTISRRYGVVSDRRLVLPPYLQAFNPSN